MMTTGKLTESELLTHLEAATAELRSRLCPRGSESSGLLHRREAEEDKTRDGEFTESAAPIAPTDGGLAEALGQLSSLWRKESQVQLSNYSRARNNEARARAESSATLLVNCALELDRALDRRRRASVASVRRNAADHPSLTTTTKN